VRSKHDKNFPGDGWSSKSERLLNRRLEKRKAASVAMPWSRFYNRNFNTAKLMERRRSGAWKGRPVALWRREEAFSIKRNGGGRRNAGLLAKA